MVGRERRILVGLAVAMFFGITVYFRLWMIDYSVSSHDTEEEDSLILQTRRQWMNLQSGG
ncbi:hypothetical protein EPI10_018197 [Gossypium australe]|uniref:Uncharacterized protein n=1 Tax=Gossypium australe TaxID=47621 RepID=A0A5B6UCT0_9ROSI|nr:hypothetical protein EPI10_018197 [Gossypium australe]